MKIPLEGDSHKIMQSEGEAASLVLQAHGLHKTFEGGKKLIDSLTLDVRIGSNVALVGENGCGKTTLLAILAGILPPDKGKVVVGGTTLDLRNGRARKNLGYAPDEHPVHMNLTWSEYLIMMAALYGLTKKEGAKRIAELEEEFNLNGLGSGFLTHFSHGMAKRALLAGALISDPAVLLLDEPETSLDAITLERLTANLTRRKERGKSSLVATHRLDWARSFCDVVLLMKNGRTRVMAWS